MGGPTTLGGVGGTPNLLPSPTFGQNTPPDENAWSGELEPLIRLSPQRSKVVFGRFQREGRALEAAPHAAGWRLRPGLQGQVGRRTTRGQIVANRIEIDPLVAPLVVPVTLPFETLVGDRMELAGEVADQDALHAGARAAPRHLVE